MPFLLVVIMGFHAFVAIFSAAAIVGAPLNLMRYTWNGQVVSGLTFLRSAGLYFLVIGTVAGVVAYALRKEKLWARDFAVLSWATVGVAMLLWNLWQSTTEHAIDTAVNMGAYVAFHAW